ncbi:phytanoyl-CoA dioxygenase family protein [Actinoplanes oblitus]|uniref:Phytanoyl-CoA dioxygenase family protein n=1 Tax=Actinoplanes oblitus TaxID=3040509 RepID=A0ABY8WEZ9_9ACTN|nr:phytanoyl-CoA dioxygenase family protein [Actinoplanes oblitus]WIM96431.1 phytanoyl-CoA dioxygenase family protein [Actinoplanes oblitus]
MTTFDSDGFVFPHDGLTTGECARYLAAFDQYDREASERGGLRAAFRHFPKIHLLAPWADELIRHPAVLSAVSRLLGPDLLVWSTNVFVREPGSTSGMAWHQDALHYSLKGFHTGAVRVWLALTPADLRNGAMRFSRGSHRAGIVGHRTGADRAAIRSVGLEIDVEIDEDTVVPAILGQGQFSMHHMAVAHCSGGNATTADRVGFAIDYLRPDVAPVGGPDGAMLVNGTDTHGNFELESPVTTSGLAVEEQFRRSVLLRMQRLGLA